MGLILFSQGFLSIYSPFSFDISSKVEKNVGFLYGEAHRGLWPGYIRPITSRDALLLTSASFVAQRMRIYPQAAPAQIYTKGLAVYSYANRLCWWASALRVRLTLEPRGAKLILEENQVCK